eukprot:6962536-Alexandrium_andersonii.AAC.1
MPKAWPRPRGRVQRGRPVASTTLPCRPSGRGMWCARSTRVRLTLAGRGVTTPQRWRMSYSVAHRTASRGRLSGSPSAATGRPSLSH